MNCPKCKAETETVMFQTIQVDRCTGCKGIWFDVGEHQDLRELVGSEAIDTGDSEAGKRSDQIEDIDCPKCNEKMVRMVGLDQPDIWYEKCPTCSGVFFDAGEFKGFKEETATDFFRDLFAKSSET